MRLPEAARSLRSREFRAFFGAQTISQIATWILSVAQAWLILSLTNSPLLLGLINLLHGGPILLLAIPGGAIIDRVVKRRVLIAKNECVPPRLTRNSDAGVCREGL